MSVPHILTTTGEPIFAAFVASGTELIVAGKELRRFAVLDGDLLASQDLASEPIIAAVSDDRTLIAILFHGLVEVRDVYSLQIQASLELPGYARAIRFSADGTMIAIRDAANIGLYRTSDLKQSGSLIGNDQFLEYDILFLPGERLAATSDNGVDIFDLTTGQCIQSLPFAESDALPSIKLLLNSERLGGLSTFYYLEEDTTTGSIVQRFRCNWVKHALSLSTHGWLVTGDISGWIDILDDSTGTRIRRLRGHTAAISSFDIDHSGRYLVSVSKKSDVRLWELSRAVTDPAAYRLTGDEFSTLDDIAADDFCFTPDGNELLTARRGAIQRWSIPALELLSTFHIPSGQEGVQFLSVHEAFAGLWMEEELITFRAWLFDLEKQQSQFLFDFPIEYPKFTRVNRAKTIIATFADEKLQLLTYPTGRVSHVRVTHGGPIDDSRFCGLEFSPGDELLYTAGRDGTLHEWNPATGDVLRSYHAPEGNIESFCLSPDGTLLAISEKNRLVIFDIQSWQPLRAFEQSYRVHWSSLAITTDNSKLAFATNHRSEIEVRSIQTGDVLKHLKGHTSGVRNVCWSPNGEWLASAADDETVKLWKID